MSVEEKENKTDKEASAIDPDSFNQKGSDSIGKNIERGVQTDLKKFDKKTDPNRLGKERIGRLLLEFSVPAIIMMVFNMLYNVVDTAILGWFVGETGVAVTTLALPVMTVLMAFSMLPGMGGNALAAIQLGQGKIAQVERTLGNSTLLLIALALFVMLCAFFFIDPVLMIIGTPTDLWEPTKIFVRIISSMYVFQSLGAGLNNFLRTAGKPNLSLITSVFGTIMCIVLNFLFVAAWGWGIAGSALATVGGQFFGMVPVVCYFIFVKSAPFRLKLSCCRPDFKLIGSILMLGLASFAMQLASTLVNIVFNQVVTTYGATDPLGAAGALAAIGVAQKACIFVFAFMIGLTMGMQPIVGYNYGAKRWDRVIKTLKWACIWGFIFGAIYLAISHIFPSQLVGLFGITGDLESFAIMCVQVYTLFYPLVGFQIVGGSYFQSSGQPIKATVIELLRQVILLIPMYLILPPIAYIFGTTPLMMIIISTPLSDILSVIVTSILVFVEVRKLRKLRVGMKPEGGLAEFQEEIIEA